MLIVSLLYLIHLALPLVLKSPKDVNATLDQTITLTCKATGKPVPTTTWLKNGKPILNTKVAASQLVLPSLTAEDDGIYQCQFNNVVGHTLSDPCRVKVYCKYLNK